MKEGRKPEYQEKTPGDELKENATYYSTKIQAPSETRTRAVALKAAMLTVTPRVAPVFKLTPLQRGVKFIPLTLDLREPTDHTGLDFC